MGAFVTCELCKRTDSIAKMECYVLHNNKLKFKRTYGRPWIGNRMICRECLYTIRNSGDDYPAIPS